MILLASIVKKRMRIAAAGAAALFFVMLVVGRSSRPISYLRLGIVHLLSPIADAGAFVAGYVTGVPEQEVRALQEDSRQLTVARAEKAVLAQENESLRRLLGVQEDVALQIVGVGVLSYTHMMGIETLVIGAGQEVGIAEGDIVIDEHRSLVGHVTEAAAGSAKVSVASNPDVTFSAELVPLGGNMLIRGLGGRGLALELIPYDTPLRDGDFVLWTQGDRGGQTRRGRNPPPLLLSGAGGRRQE